ncbi:MAG: hypothetical protein DLM73_06950 [Chthoniobacterales bacterium]|nr:MAG: hypothetical protein DLM73_06950 [Chthoniobacterales bacterium]
MLACKARSRQSGGTLLRSDHRICASSPEEVRHRGTRWPARDTRALPGTNLTRLLSHRAQRPSPAAGREFQIWGERAFSVLVSVFHRNELFR